MRAGWDPELYEARHSFVWQFGEDFLDLLEAKPGERILDLGCGPGQLTNKIAACGAEVIGLDASPAMIGQARQNFPLLHFVLKDAAHLDYKDEFDAVFSNAALHWMLDREAVVRGVAAALKPGGRFVAELGARGNIRAIERAVETVSKRYLGDSMPARRTYFPALGEYASLLETHGLEVRFATLFDRPTPLVGSSGMENWIRQFKAYYFEALASAEATKAIQEAAEELRPIACRNGIWTADYRRLRFVAVKV
ncbi:MAG TPA: methyltransferase domain-containing protein [Bryobacteraceae bacterium]|jgi:trans-aconitate 2-methyltransferase|nr:methyltransferase domain-containing protein [Bryobacteraceae bacterium]